jgi:hypothetical protein
MQVVPPVQASPHAPQFEGLRVTSTQLPAHNVDPAGHVTLQTPLAQTWPAAHAVPQAPQCRGSVAVATQTPPHS